MELLLLLSALLSGLTGAMAGQRAAEVPQLERSTVQGVSEAAVAQASEVAAQFNQQRPVAPAIFVQQGAARPLSQVETLAGWYPKNEKRLE